MTALPKPATWINPEEFLEGELTAAVRHEYVEGQVFAMAGASDDHGRIAGNIHALLWHQLRGRPCESFVADMKVKIPSAWSSAFYYPDVLVACDPREADRYYREHPAIIFEVTSPATEATDRREKVAAYLQIAELQAYVIVAQERACVTVRRRSGAAWEMVEFTGLEDALKLEGIGCELTLAQIYERVSWRGEGGAA